MAKDDERRLRAVQSGIDPETGEVLSDEEARRSLRDLTDEAALHSPGLIRGDEQQLTFDISSPYDLIASRVKVKSFEVGVVGQFPMGSTLRLTVDIELGDPGFKRRKDAHGVVTGVERIHGGEVVGWAQATE